MNIVDKILLYHSKTHNQSIPGKSYFVGLEVTEVVKYLDTGNLHEVPRFCWIEYLFNHTGRGITYQIIYAVMNDPDFNKEQREWFGQKCTDLFKLGFQWSESAGAFSLPGTWSCYWEQVNNADKAEWAEYMTAINDVIANKA